MSEWELHQHEGYLPAETEAIGRFPRPAPLTQAELSRAVLASEQVGP